MTTTVTYAVTMPELRADTAPSSLWSNYGAPVHMSPRMRSNLETGIVPPSAVSPHSSRPRSEAPNMDHPAYSYGRYSHDEAEPYNGHGHAPGLPSHGFQNSLKRTFSQAEGPAGQELVQDLRGEDASRMNNANQDHKLLAFRPPLAKHTITDHHGRVQSLELAAQLHGMFFLSEMPTNASDGTALAPELTCYRRNLFQISGSLVTPRGPLSVITESETVPINNMEVTISAIESVDGNPVRLIVIPWKTPPPNSPEVAHNPDQEPPALPLIPFQEDPTETTEGDFAVYPIGWRRLQFRIATANNGRRKELQQHFVLHLKVFATLANNTKVVLTESTTSPIVVRGRSPRNFQARKEIPLLGSSAGSRGQALVETGLGVVAGVTMKQQGPKSKGSMEHLIQRAPPFNFNSPKPGGVMNPIRPSGFPGWGGTTGPLPQVQPTTTGSYHPPTTMAPDMYHKLPLTSGSSFNAETAEMPLQTTVPPSVPVGVITEERPLGSQYTYAPPRHLPLGANSQAGPDSTVSIPRFVDDGRPSKAPRTGGQQTVHGSNSLPTGEAPGDYRYGAYTPVSNGAGEVNPPSYVPETTTTTTTTPHSAPSRELYQSPSTWTTSAGESSSTVAYAAPDGRPYAYDQYKDRPSSGGQHIKTGGQGSHPEPYNGAHRGSFDGLTNYSWGNS